MANIAQVLRNKMRMLRDDAIAVGKVVDDAFRGKDSVEDDDLDAELRQLFYDLQDAHVLDVQRREYEKEGRLLRGYTWTVNEKAFVDHPTPKAPREEDLYGSLPVTVWQNRRRD